MNAKIILVNADGTLSQLDATHYPVNDLHPFVVGGARMVRADEDTMLQCNYFGVNSDSKTRQLWPTTVGGTPTAGDVLTINVRYTPWGGVSKVDHTCSYTVPSGATLASICNGLQAAVDANATLTADLFGTSVNGFEVGIQWPYYLTDVELIPSKSVGATETLTVGVDPGPALEENPRIMFQRRPVNPAGTPRSEQDGDYLALMGWEGSTRLWAGIGAIVQSTGDNKLAALCLKTTATNGLTERVRIIEGIKSMHPEPIGQDMGPGTINMSRGYYINAAPLATFGQATLDDLAAFGSLDAMPQIPLDSDIWKLARPAVSP